MKLLDDYFKLQRDVYSHFGYVEDWVVIPLDDATEYYWHLTDTEVHYSTSKSNMEAWVRAGLDFEAEGVDGNDCYSNEIYTQRHLPKWVYKADDATMVCVDTHTDGNKFLQVFDNAKRVMV